MEFERLAISQPFLKIDFWFGPKNSMKSCAEHFSTLGVIKYISGHVTGQKLFCDTKVPISLKWFLTDRHLQSIENCVCDLDHDLDFEGHSY